jgi:hypothetical protein
MMTPREELVDKVAQALETEWSTHAFDSVKLAQIAIGVISPWIGDELKKAAFGGASLFDGR